MSANNLILGCMHRYWTYKSSGWWGVVGQEKRVWRRRKRARVSRRVTPFDEALFQVAFLVRGRRILKRIYRRSRLISLQGLWGACRGGGAEGSARLCRPQKDLNRCVVRIQAHGAAGRGFRAWRALQCRGICKAQCRGSG